MLNKDAAPADAGRGKKKSTATVFELLNGHAKREFREVDKNKLIIPTTDYQRDESQGRIANDIAMNFDVVAFGVLLVIERASGQLVVADGGTRLSAARKRPDITKVPCIVFSGLTDKQEGDVFLRVNDNRRRLQIEQLHHAQLFSEHDLALTSQHFIDQLQLNSVGFDSLSTMRSCVKSNTAALEILVPILLTVARERHVTARVMKGLFRLEVMLQKDERTLHKTGIIRRMHATFGSFDAVVNAVVKPRTVGNTTDMAMALARTLKIKLKE